MGVGGERVCILRPEWRLGGMVGMAWGVGALGNRQAHAVTFKVLVCQMGSLLMFLIMLIVLSATASCSETFWVGQDASLNKQTTT